YHFRGIIYMASTFQASMYGDVARKYGGLTYSGHLDVKSASQLQIFSRAETLICLCRFNRNSVTRKPNLKCSVTWFKVSRSAQQAMTNSLCSEPWGCLPKFRNSSKIVNKTKQGKVGWSVICCAGRSKDDHETGGDPKTQDILVEIVKLEVSKVRMAELLDESSEKIRNIGLQTQLDYAQLAELTVKRLDASGSQVLSQLDANADAFRQELNLANANIE
ncbi:hypothetical protein KI387_015208, partial [Taxus chinensis]